MYIDIPAATEAFNTGKFALVLIDISSSHSFNIEDFIPELSDPIIRHNLLKFGL